MITLMADFVVIGTWNTKGEEVEFVCRELAKRNHNPVRLDPGLASEYLSDLMQK